MDRSPAWVLFDGTCALCDGTVEWLLPRDRRGALRFAPLQGEVAEEVRGRHPELPEAVETFVLVESPRTPEERVRVRSDAALRTLALLGGGWRLLAGLLRLVPRPLRDAGYRFVAGRRTRWFGRLAAVRAPTAEDRWRFLEPSGDDAGGGADTG